MIRLQSVLKAVTDEYGAVDILINNAGITRDNILGSNEGRGVG